MVWALIGILIGIIFGLRIDIPIPLELTRYTAVISIGILDALFGAIRAEVTKDKYNAIKYDTTANFKYKYNGTNTYNFSKIYNNETHLMTTMCHMGDILYNWTQISFWADYFNSNFGKK